MVASTSPAPGRGRLLTLWTPEDKEFWAREGSLIANQNLWISIPALFLAFAIWMVWSPVVVQMKAVGFPYSTDQLFWLTAVPALAGATLRIFYSFIVPIVGGRRWTVLSTLSLLISVGIFGWFGGDFRTVKMPDGIMKEIWLQNAAFMWVIPIAVSALLAFLMMHDIADATASFSEQAVIFKRKHNWLMCWLYLGTFGSFMGFSAGFPLLIKSQFPTVNPLSFAWMGPFVGALARPFGGWLADRMGGARVSLWNFVVMIVGVCGVLYFLPRTGMPGNLTGFFLSFMLLFLTSGIGNGSTFQMIPVIFMNEAMEAARGKGRDAEADAAKEGTKLGAAVLGFSAAIGAYGGFFIPMSYGTSLKVTGSPHAALAGFIVFYVICIVLTWWYYARKGAERPC